MKNIIACVQMSSGDNVNENLATAKKYIEQAVDQGARLVVLPEMFALMSVDVTLKLKHKEKMGQGLIQDFLAREAEKNGIWLVGGTIPITNPEDPDKAFAACLIMNDKGHCVARYDKIHLFDVQIATTRETYLESNTISAGHHVTVVSTPFGKLGIAVCYDVRFPELFRHMHREQVEVIVLPSAFTYTTGKMHWDVLVKARAIENLCYVAAACQTGSHPGNRKTWGHSMIVTPWGEEAACLPEHTGVLTSDIDLTYLHELREKFPALLHKKL